MPRRSRVSEEKIREIISKSGYLDEQKTIVEFEKLGFFAGANYAFEDQDTQQSREIDLIATKYTDFVFGTTGFYFFAYGEVKKRTNPLVFFERKPERPESRDAFIPIVATQEFFPNIELALDIKKILRFSKLHHQVKHDFISTQFCEIDRNKAGHKNLYESVFVPLLKCVDSEIASMRKSTRFFDLNTKSYFLNVFQPVIVISGPLYAYNVYEDSLTEKNYILYRRHYASRTIKRTLLIDVVKKDHLPDYISQKLIKTYWALEASLKKQMSQIIEYCVRDRLIQTKKVDEMMRIKAYPKRPPPPEQF